MALSWFNRLLKSSSRPAVRRRPARVRLGLEALERRDLMSVLASVVNGQLLVSGESLGDTITVDHSQAATLVSGTGLNTTSFPDSSITNGILILPAPSGSTVNILAEAASTTIDGGRGGFTAKVGKNGSLAGVQGSLSLINLVPDSLFLNVDDSAGPAAPNVTMGASNGVGFVSGLTQAPISYTADGLVELQVHGPQTTTTYTITDTAAAAREPLTKVFGGNGNNTFNVQGNSSELDITGGTGNDIFNVGSTTNTLGPIKGLLILDGGGAFGTDTLNVNDQGTTTPQTYTLSNNHNPRDEVSQLLASDAPNGITFFNVRNENLNAGSGNNTIDVQQLFSNVLLNVFAGAGNNTFNVGNKGFTLDDVQGGVFLHGGGGSNTLNVNDQAAAAGETYTIQPTSLLRIGAAQAPATINFDASVKALTVNGTNTGFTNGVFNVVDTPKNAVTTLNTGSGNSTVNVEGTSGPLFINAVGGNQHVNIGLNNSVKSINGAVTLTNSIGETGLAVLDAAGPAAPNVTMGIDAQHFGFITGLAPAPIKYAQNDVSGVTVHGPQGATTYTITDTAKSNKVSIGTLIVAGFKGGNTFNVQKTTGGLEIEDGAGKNTINIGSTANTLDTIQGPVSVLGALGGDTLNINDQGSKTPHTYFQGVTFQKVNFLRRSGAAEIDFTHIANLHINKGPVLGSPPKAKGLKLTQPAQGSRLVLLTGRLTDAHRAAKLTMTVDWGDGSPPQSLKPGQSPFRLDHQYARKGAYTVRVVWTDVKTRESNSQDLRLMVA
jgi:hypothetical protein